MRPATVGPGGRSAGGARPAAPVRAAPVRAAPASVIALLAVVVALAGCATEPDPVVTFPPSTFGSGVVTAATDTTRASVERALAGLGFTATPAQSPYRPGEAQRFTEAPRLVLEVVIPASDVVVPISIYEFSNDDAAASAGDEQARYVASPVGQVLFPPGTQFVVRRLGRTVVFYDWLPADEEPAEAEIATALAAIGIEIEVPR